MDNPAYLMSQYAAQCGLSKELAKRSMLLKAYAGEGKKVYDAACLVGISEQTAKRVARKMIIDFVDYRPYAAKEKKGEARPEPYFREDLPAANLPLFA
jgi:transposase